MNNGGEMNDGFLVSVIVITYNSADFIVETLESISAQDYSNIELIVADDNSKDATAQVCSDWLSTHGSRFRNAKLVTTEVNTGIAGNCNRGLKSASGEWVKMIAGDDLLEINCISQFVQYVLRHPEVSLCCCGILPFSKDKKFLPFYSPEWFFAKSAKGQLKTLITRGSMIPGPSLFYKKHVCEALGGFDEQIPFMEDYPFLVRASAAGYRFALLREPLVRYRLHERGISRSASRIFEESAEKCFSRVILPALKREKMFFHLWHYGIKSFIDIRRDSPGVFRYLFVRRLVGLFDPIKYVLLFYRILGRSYVYHFEFVDV